MSSATEIPLESLRSWFRSQAAACHKLASPLYARLLADVAERLSDDEVDLIGPGWRFGDMVPLRLMGLTHRLCLEGRLPALAEHFPSCNGTSDRAVAGDDSLADLVFESWALDPQYLKRYLSSAVQTNEVSRSAALFTGFQMLTRSSPATFDVIEIGTSAGLNLRNDQYGYFQNGKPLGGNPNATLRFDDVWHPIIQTGSEPANWSARKRIGLDPHPIDVSDPDQAQRLMSFVWPDQTQRFTRLRQAIEIAAEVPVSLEQTTATDAWLGQHLPSLIDGSPAGGVIIIQSIVWQYIPPEQRWAITAAIETAGQRATNSHPLSWLTMEPDDFNRDRAAVRLRRWPGGGGALLGHADYHGRWVEPLPTLR